MKLSPQIFNIEFESHYSSLRDGLSRLRRTFASGQHAIYLVKKVKEPSRPQSQNLTESTHLHGASEKGRADLLRRKKSLGTKDE
jgi:hypothetical protein